MSSLRKYIRNTLLEAFNTPNLDNIQDRLAFIKIKHDIGTGGFLYGVFDAIRFDLFNPSTTLENLKESLVGVIKVDELANCNNSYAVDYVAADFKLGPTMYDIVSMDPEIPGGIVADRYGAVREKAQDIWKYYFEKRRADLELMLPLDDFELPITLPREDDCKLNPSADPNRSPYVDLFFRASILWMDENYPEQFEIEKFWKLSLDDASHYLGSLWDGERIDVLEDLIDYTSIDNFFLEKVARFARIRKLPSVATEIKSRYKKFAKKIVEDPSLLSKYIGQDMSGMAMNFSFKVKIQPEWYEMEKKGNRIMSNLEKQSSWNPSLFKHRFVKFTKEFFDERYE